MGHLLPGFRADRAGRRSAAHQPNRVISLTAWRRGPRRGMMPAAMASANDNGVRIVFGTLDLPDREAGFRLLERYVEAGGRALDVANVYQDGDAARTVGRW